MDTSNHNQDHDSHVAAQRENDNNYMPPSPSMSESSMIFERNVEDPSYLYKTVSNNAANSLSRQSSRTSLFNHNNSSNRNFHNLSQRSSAVNLHLQPSRTNESIASYQTYNPDFVVQTPLDHRRTLENFVPPALDAGCSIVTDDTTGLDDVDMVYSRRPSTIGLDRALGRTRSLSSQSFDNETSPAHLRSPNDHGSRLLRFYSYADMLSDDNNNNVSNATSTSSTANPLRRPPMQGHYSFSSSLLNSPSHLPSPPSASASPPQHMNFTNPFIISRRYSNTTINNANGGTSAGSTTGAALSRSPSNQQYLLKQQRSPSGSTRSRRNSNRPGSAANIMIGKPKSKFHIESSGSEGFSSEEEDNTMIERDKLNLKQKLQSQLAQPPSIANMVNDNHNNTNKHKNTINNNIKNSPAFTNSNPSSKSNSNSTITSMNPDTTK
ncbi:Vhs2p [Saccharomyces cerevisiae YJM1342]|nr:Vhs2p [Saccharomyces cerevisiae YJM1342]